MKVLITGGGTGGHIYPAIAIANKIKDEIQDVEILFVGTKKGLERDLVPKAGFKLETITVSGFKRSLSIDTLKTIKDLGLGLRDAAKIIKKFKPDLVIGTGGFVCGPVVFMASFMNIKTLIHEQNVIPGATNKILSKIVNRILISFKESEKYFSNKNKLVISGNPIRKEFLSVNKRSSREELGFDEDSLVVLTFGGSRGADKINDTMLEVIEQLNGREDIRIIHVTGNGHYDKAMMKLDEKYIQLKENILIKEYVHDMPKVMGACDLAICRSGAITLAEITGMGLPSILIPSPYVTNNHQEHNAKVLEEKGAAILITEKKLNSDSITELLNFFVKNRDKLEEMGYKSKQLASPNAIEIIYDTIASLMSS